MKVLKVAVTTFSVQESSEYFTLIPSKVRQRFHVLMRARLGWERELAQRRFVLIRSGKKTIHFCRGYLLLLCQTWSVVNASWERCKRIMGNSRRSLQFPVVPCVQDVITQQTRLVDYYRLLGCCDALSGSGQSLAACEYQRDGRLNYITNNCWLSTSGWVCKCHFPFIRIPRQQCNSYKWYFRQLLKIKTFVFAGAKSN